MLPLCRTRQTAFFWVGGQVAIAQKFARHPRQRQMRAVEAAQAQIVEAVVIVAGKARRARRVLPDPFAKSILQLLLLLSSCDGFLLVDGARAVVMFVIGGRRASVQGVLDEARGVKALSSPGRGVADARFHAIVDLDSPGGNRIRVRDLHVVLPDVEQLGHEIPDVGRWNPGRAQPRLDVAGLKIGRLHAFQGRDVAVIGGVQFGGAARDREFRPDIAAQIAIGGFPISSLGIAVDEGAEFLLQEAGGPARHLFHAGPVDLAGFIE